MSNAPWFETGRLAEQVVRISEPNVHRFFRANLYHVTGRDADLVIDFGMGLRSLREYLDLPPGKPVLAIATHVHVDHVGSFHEFEHRLGHSAEQEAFSQMQDADTLADYFRKQPECVADLPVKDWDPTNFKIAAAPLSEVLVEGSFIDIGNACYHVLHLPGHSPGSVGLFDEQSGTLFCGDAIYDGALVDDLPGCDVSQYVETMERLRKIDISVAFGGHGPPMSRERMHHIAETYLRANN